MRRIRSCRWLSSSVPVAKISSDNASAPLSSELIAYSQRNETHLSLSRLLALGSDNHIVTENSLLRSAVFLHTDLPTRLAKRAVELNSLPHDLSHTAAIKEVRNTYAHSFHEIISKPKPGSMDSERRFSNMVKEMYERHSGVLWNIARGIYQLKTSHKYHKNDPLTRFSLPEAFPGIQSFLDEFLLSRIGIRVMIGQHIALHEYIEGWIGLFCLQTSPFDIAQSAAKSATVACMRRYNTAPWVNIKNLNDDLRFAYIPAHLHHILFELLKNSMRATIEKLRCVNIDSDAPAGNEKKRFRYGSELILPPIEIVIRKDKFSDDVLIEVIDSGGGFETDEELRNAWSYMYTTASAKECEELFTELNKGDARDFDANEKGLPLAGLGYGLPICKIFAKYLGGDLKIENYKDGAKATLTVKAVNANFSAI